MSIPRSIILAMAVALFSTSVICAQTKRKTRPAVKKTGVTVIAPAPGQSPIEPTAVTTESKKNERPATNSTSDTQRSATFEHAYFYEFSQPDFTIKRIVIEHDETGRGTIAFTKKMFGDSVTEPIQVSAEALERIKSSFASLNFIDSSESYQYEKDYSHLGTITIRLKKGDKQRTASFNYTLTKDAKILADEYRKIGNQFIWQFDIGVARENQPLESPKLLDAVESLLKRNELSDPNQLLPLLKGMVDDERVPLIARNHAGKLAAKIEKGRDK